MGLLSFAGDLLGGFLGNDAAEDRQNSAQEFSANQFATRYQTQVKDMAAAGLNPMLSYMTGASGQPSGASAGAISYGNIGTNSAAADQSSASAEQARSQSNLIDETVAKVKQEVTNLVTVNNQAKATIDNLKVQYQNLVKEGYNITEQGNVMRATISKLLAEVPNIRQSLALIQNQMKSEAGRAALLGLDVKAAEDLGNMGRSVGQFEGLFRILSMVLRSH
nr:MAG: DNA pilot protein [Microvirus sp.]